MLGDSGTNDTGEWGSKGAGYKYSRHRDLHGGLKKHTSLCTYGCPSTNLYPKTNIRSEIAYPRLWITA